MELTCDILPTATIHLMHTFDSIFIILLYAILSLYINQRYLSVHILYHSDHSKLVRFFNAYVIISEWNDVGYFVRNQMKGIAFSHVSSTFSNLLDQVRYIL